MSSVMIRRLVRTFTPSDRAQDETKQLWQLQAGERVVWASLRIVTRSETGVATSTYRLGDGSDTDGYIADTNTDQAAGTIVAGAGAYTNQAGGKLYTAADTVDLVYTANTGGATTPACKVYVAVARDWPQ